MEKRQMKSIVASPWEFACQWYGVDEIHKSITRSPLLRSIGDLPPVPKDVESLEFAEFLTEQYRLAMRKGAELSIAEMKQSSKTRPSMPDDNEPITKEWLAEVCYAENGPKCFGFDNESFWFEVQVNDDSSLEFFMSGEPIPGDRIKTRGDVREVCWMIGCEWFHECWGEP